MRSSREILEELAESQKRYSEALENLHEAYFEEQKALREELEDVLEAQDEQNEEEVCLFVLFFVLSFGFLCFFLFGPGGSICLTGFLL
jgi:hypothetical protein